MRCSTFARLLLSLTTLFGLAGCGMSDDSGGQSSETNGGDHLTTASLAPTVIYGDDNRLDLYDVKNAARITLADSTVALMFDTDLQVAGDQTRIKEVKFGDAYGLCPTERFRDQDTAAFCSGFLIAPDKIATAGHCVTSADDCAHTRFIFGYSLYTPTGSVAQVANHEVYACKSIVRREQIGDGQDYAVVQLDRRVANHAPLKLRTSGDPALTDQLMVIGHPSGLPTKIADGAVIRSVNPMYLVASLDTYQGNSGSAVFNVNTNLVEGILVRGEQDFVYQNNCSVSKRCAQNACRGEDVTRISFVLPYAK